MRTKTNAVTVIHSLTVTCFARSASVVVSSCTWCLLKDDASSVQAATMLSGWNGSDRNERKPVPISSASSAAKPSPRHALTPSTVPQHADKRHIGSGIRRPPFDHTSNHNRTSPRNGGFWGRVLPDSLPGPVPATVTTDGRCPARSGRPGAGACTIIRNILRVAYPVWTVTIDSRGGPARGGGARPRSPIIRNQEAIQ